MSDWTVEPLFATPLVVDDLPAAIDVGAVAACVEATGVHALARHGPAFDALTARMRGWADRMTARPDGVGASAPWSVVADAVGVAAGTSLPLPPRWDAYWTGLCCLAGDGAMLAITDPRLPATMMEAPDLRLRTGRGPDDLYAPETRDPFPPRRSLLMPGWLSCTIVASTMPIAVLRVSFVAPSEGDRR